MASLANTTVVLEAALAELKSAYTEANPESYRCFQRARVSMPGGNTRSNLYYDPFPLCIKGGEGAFLLDVDGGRYLDFLCEYTAGPFGHSNPRLLKAIRDVSEQGLNLGAQNQLESLFAKALCERFPGIERIRFANSGTEANLCAIGAARAFTGRSKILVFDGGYHGGTLSFTTADNPLNVPFEFLIARYNDMASVAALLDAHQGEVAAVLIEPMLSSGGCIPGDPQFLRELRLLTSASDVLLIFDEVVTSRLGEGGLHAELGVAPDLITIGKYIGGGLNCGAFGGRCDILDQFDPTMAHPIAHAGTFNNNTLSMGVGLVAMTEVFTTHEAARINAVGQKLRTRLNDLCGRGGVAMTFSGVGAATNLHFTSEPVVRPTSATRGHRLEKALFFFHMLTRGIYIAPRGMINIGMAHTEDDVERLYLATEAFVSRYDGLIASRQAEQAS